MNVTLHHGDALEVLKGLADNSVDAVVTDPPYGLSKEPDAAEVLRHWLAGDDYTHRGGGFMGKSWDSFVPGPALWREIHRVLKPGGHALVFAGSRTQDLMGLSLRLAGFEIRDSLAWLYGSGFPKSLDVSKAIDKAAGATREIVGPSPFAARKPHGTWTGEVYGDEPSHAEGPSITAPATPAAQQWAGWGTALKPAHEPIIVARKPLTGTVAANVQSWGTGALNIDGTRVGNGGQLKWEKPRDMGYHGGTNAGPVAATENTAGRWPANVVLDEAAAGDLDAQSGPLHTQDPETRKSKSKKTGATGFGTGRSVEYDDEKGTGASRFFYVAKAPKKERPVVDGVAHPTVKPLALMRWLVRLVTPPSGVVLDPFAGSGTTLEAAVLEGFNAVGIEMTEEYLPLIQARLDRATSSNSTEE